MFKPFSYRLLLTLAGLSFTSMVRGALPSEIEVRLDLAGREFIQGERIRAVVDVANSSAEAIVVTNTPWADKLFVELFRASDMYRFQDVGKLPHTAAFVLAASEGQKLETFLGDHYSFEQTTRYFAKAVLVHGGMRFESALKSFDVLPGVKVTAAMQMFAKRPGLRRGFELVCWNRGRVEHLFLKVRDEGGRRWTTTDLGPVLRMTPPRIAVQPDGQVMVLHRATQDEFIRTTFWSLPEDFVFREHGTMADPDTAGAKRVKEMYLESGGVTPVKKVWWKFW